MIQKFSTTFLQEIAALRGGFCLGKYVKAHDKIEWQCANGHRWFASFSNIYYNNSWCPHCKIGLSENICKLYFETIFNEQFIKIRPEWLKNDNGNRLELDGYCAKLGIAFEHNGEQHYSDNNPWKKDLLIRQSWDEIKIALCKENNIKLIIIPQLFSRLKLNNLQAYLKKTFIDQNIILPENYDQITFDLSKIKDSASFIEYKLIAENKGGKCLSTEYKSCKEKLLWQCEKQHTWWAKPYTIKVGSWCPICAGKVSMSIEEVKELISIKDGTLLSNEYKNIITKILIRCNVCANEWWASLDKIKQGRWCPKCANKKRGPKRKNVK
jgi:hypothetical protein